MTTIGLSRLGSIGGSRAASAVALTVAMAVGLASVGAFGCYIAMSFAVRLAHFVTASLLIAGAASGLSFVLRRYVFAGTLPLWGTCLIAVATAPPGALIVLQSLELFAPHALRHVTFVEITAQVLALNLLIGIAIRMTSGAPASLPVNPSPSVDRAAALRAKLPHALREGTILAMSAEDHYLRVRTDRGQALILMDLTGAAAALGPDAGVRIHRSHWVAAALLADIGHDGVAIDDVVLPISRAGRRLLKEKRAAATAGYRVGTGLSPR